MSSNYLKYITKAQSPINISGQLNESSIKILQCLLTNQNPLSTKELVKKCNVSSRMIQYNLEKMLKQKPPLIAKSPDVTDMRLQRYTINPNLDERVDDIKNLIQLKINKFNQ